jgi:hypothetical protein
MPLDPTLHGVTADQLYVMLQSLLKGEDHPLHKSAVKLAREYCEQHQAEMIQRSVEQRHKRAS